MSESEQPEHAVIVHLAMPEVDSGSDLELIFELEDALIAAIADAGVGEFDGNEVGGGEVILFAYGPDADALFDVMQPVLTEFGPPPGSFAIKRYGSADDASAPETQVELG